MVKCSSWRSRSRPVAKGFRVPTFAHSRQDFKRPGSKKGLGFGNARGLGGGGGDYERMCIYMACHNA